MHHRVLVGDQGEEVEPLDLLAAVQEAQLDEVIEVSPGESDRFSELMSKRKRTGLTDNEAEELGRLVAEREGQSYWSTQSSREQQAPGSEG